MCSRAYREKSKLGKLREHVTIHVCYDQLRSSRLRPCYRGYRSSARQISKMFGLTSRSSAEKWSGHLLSRATARPEPSSVAPAPLTAIHGTRSTPVTESDRPEYFPRAFSSKTNETSSNWQLVKFSENLPIKIGKFDRDIYRKYGHCPG